jgi:integrase
VLLGKFNTKASRVEYARVLAEWEAAGRRLPQPAGGGADLTVNELMLLLWPHADRHYRGPDGVASNEPNDFRLSLRPLRALYGHTGAANFGPLSLKAVQRATADGSWMTEREKAKELQRGKPVGCSRGVTNQRVGRVRRIFRWAVENELVPPSVLHGLQAVRGLQKGRGGARETEPVKPVPLAYVEAVLPHLLPEVAAMVQLQLHTTMRPDEVVMIRAIDIDMAGKVWLYHPGTHKTAWRGHRRVVPVGPQVAWGKGQGPMTPAAPSVSVAEPRL